MTRSLYDDFGGEDKFRQIIATFIDRVFEDRMISFFFRHSDKGRIATRHLRGKRPKGT